MKHGFINIDILLQEVGSTIVSERHHMTIITHAQVARSFSSHKLPGD